MFQVDLPILLFACLALIFLAVFSLPVILFFVVRWAFRRRRDSNALRLIEKWTQGL